MNQMKKVIWHAFTPVTLAEAPRFKAEFDRLFPTWIIMEKINAGTNSFLNGNLTVIEWSHDDIRVIHHVTCTVRIKTEFINHKLLYNIIATPHVSYYKIDVVQQLRVEGICYSRLLRLLIRHKTEQGQDGRDVRANEFPQYLTNGFSNMRI